MADTSIRLRVDSGDGEREYVFDRSEVSFGVEPFHDLVIEADDAPDVRGVFRAAGGGIEFASRLCGVEVRIVRDGQTVATVEPDAECRRSLEPGDAIEFGQSPSISVTVDSLQGRATGSAELERVDVSGIEEQLERADDFVPLWSAASTIAGEPNPERFVEAVADAVERTAGCSPLEVRTTVAEEGGGLYVERATFDASRDGNDHAASQRAEALDGAGHTGRRGWAHREISGRLEPGEIATVRDENRARLYMRLAGDSLSALLAVHVGGDVPDRSLRRAARCMKSLRQFGSLVVDFCEQQRRTRALGEENRYFRGRQRRRYLFKDIVAESEAMEDVYERLHDWVAHRFPVLIAGEAGTGKSLMARALHHLGPRADGVFLRVNCRSLSDDALELELFGSTESELVDAVGPRKGVFELADRGTVFLEGIEHVPRETQEGLLRLLRESEVRRIGGAVGRPVDTRLVASTRWEPESLVERGACRRDLCVQLRQHQLEVPPLRERRPDILPLARVYLSTFAKRYERRCRDFGPELAAQLRDHDWPGNARELKTVVETAVLNVDDAEILTREHVARGSGGEEGSVIE